MLFRPYGRFLCTHSQQQTPLRPSPGRTQHSWTPHWWRARAEEWPSASMRCRQMGCAVLYLLLEQAGRLQLSGPIYICPCQVCRLKAAAEPPTVRKGAPPTASSPSCALHAWPPGPPLLQHMFCQAAVTGIGEPQVELVPAPDGGGSLLQVKIGATSEATLGHHPWHVQGPASCLPAACQAVRCSYRSAPPPQTLPPASAPARWCCTARSALCSAAPTAFPKLCCQRTPAWVRGDGSGVAPTLPNVNENNSLSQARFKAVMPEGTC